jgi:WD40 repeat protein
MWCVQSKSYRRGLKLVACLTDENRVLIHDLETGQQKEIEVERPWKCASSQHFIVITTFADGLHLIFINGVLVNMIPDSTDASCVAFHPRKTNILAIGYENGSVRFWDASKKACMSSFKKHSDGISNIRFASDGRLFLSSWDHTASIVTLNDQFQILSSVKLEGHTNWVNDILPLSSLNQCVTCSDDTIKVWDCQTGACLRTLTEHIDYVTSLTMHPNGHYSIFPLRLKNIGLSIPS